MSKTKQPSWEFIGNLGDQDPLKYGGYFIYRDRTGVYHEKAELLEVDEEGEGHEVNNKYRIYRFTLDRLKLVNGHLVPLAYDPSWGQPRMQKGAFEWMPDSDTSHKYEEWFHEHLDLVAAGFGATKEELEQAFTSADPVDRAFAYKAVGDYHGLENLDSDPLTDLSYGEVKARYRGELKKAKR